MPVTEAYTDAATYRGLIKKADVGSDVAILNDLLAVSRMIDKLLGRFFTQDAAPVARIFKPEADVTTIYTPDLVSVSSIKSDDNADGTAETELAAADYRLWPYNAATGAEPMPYRAVEATDYGARGYFACGRIVEITGVWGWPAVPEAIKRGCVELTAILRLETPRAQAQVTELGQLATMSSRGAGIVEDLIKGYRVML